MSSTDREARGWPSPSLCTSLCQGCGFQWTVSSGGLWLLSWYQYFEIGRLSSRCGFSCSCWWMNNTDISERRRLGGGPETTVVGWNRVSWGWALWPSGVGNCGQQCPRSLKCEDIPSFRWSPCTLAAGGEGPAVWPFAWISGNRVVSCKALFWPCLLGAASWKQDVCVEVWGRDLQRQIYWGCSKA